MINLIDKRKVLLIAERQLGKYMLKKMLLREDVELMCVLTDLTVNRNKWWPGELIAEICKRHSIPCYSSNNDGNILKYLMANYEPPDIAIAVLNNNFTSTDYLKWVKSNPVNLHGAPLPEYQGINCTHFAILNQEKLFGTTFYLTSEIKDQGLIISKKYFDVPQHCTNYQLYNLTVENGKLLIDEQLDNILYRRFKRLEQFDTSKAVKYGELGSREIHFVNNADASEIDRIVRAFYFPPFEPAYFYLSSKKIYVYPENMNIRENK